MNNAQGRFWFPQTGVLLLWRLHDLQKIISESYPMMRCASLALAQSRVTPGRLQVIKNRNSSLLDCGSMLALTFEEFEIVDPRRVIQLSSAETVRWDLSC